MEKIFQNLFFKLNLSYILLYLIIWLYTGITIGPSILMGPVRWITEYQFSNNIENIFVQILMLLLVIIALLLAIWLLRGINRSALDHVKLSIFALLILSTSGSLYVWLTPEFMGLNIHEKNENMSNFTCGQYLTVDRIELLKTANYSSIRSLLHPPVVPFESKLLNDGKINCQIVGPDLKEIQEILSQVLGSAIPKHLLFDPNGIINNKRNHSETIAKESTDISKSVRVFFREATPDLKTIILLSPFFILYTALAAAFSGWLREKKGVRTPYTRKIFHLFIFTMASILQFTGGLPVVALFGSIVSLAVLYAIYRGDNFPFYEAMARPTDAPHRTLFITIPLITTALGGLAANFFFGQFSYIGYLVGGWGDAVGEPVGSRWGKHKYRVPSLAGVTATRSLEGSFAVIVVSTVVAFIGLTANQFEFSTALLTAAACGTIGALVESVSNHGLDNFTIQVAAAGTAFFLLG